ncbi:hypothetical protein NYE25_06110 [Paenibacillus sp. FSL E2-8871]|jgi:hypothetical protein|uniref:Uncharacterized protein n=1 Tax=Paenibacillus odorifer TaxID=189426 RepID=A0A1R0ZMC4_9BACL|nr:MULTISPECIES: hypothetical protein [Paenibacillus]MBY3621878.1 hypothetical protein [Acinetobacter sp. CUI P1]AIQ24210.1 hypothetical protein H70737_15895 [Paenibacillus sp. FSL H7-0737]KAA1180975.1 hypothetical protein PAENI_27510 [Paenibacillus sp. B2(2019)]OMD53976.1 hypothetical protein BSK51_07170 [Paenibacillus odorifer]OME73265.1 hypothetical protein BSK65_05620 [Paenibacillus odorifer]
MNLEIVSAEMSRKEDKSYVGRTIFTLENHKAPYEITFFSTRGTEWDYSLSFAGEPGSEEQFLETDALLENDDDVYNQLLDAALDKQEIVEE